MTFRGTCPDRPRMNCPALFAGQWIRFARSRSVPKKSPVARPASERARDSGTVKRTFPFPFKELLK
jgi:hypothetical protein